MEVFFEDWKLYEGWGREAKQLDEDGSSRGLILSLLFDHCLILHPEQSARAETNCLRIPSAACKRSLKWMFFFYLKFIEETMREQHNPADKLKELARIDG